MIQNLCCSVLRVARCQQTGVNYFRIIAQDESAGIAYFSSQYVSKSRAARACFDFCPAEITSRILRFRDVGGLPAIEMQRS